MTLHVRSSRFTSAEIGSKLKINQYVTHLDVANIYF